MSSGSLPPALPKARYELEYGHGSEYSEEDKAAVLRVLAANAPSCGAEVLSFEKEFAEFTGSAYAIAVGNATQGLDIAVRAALSTDPENRKEVIVPVVSWISTASAAALAGATVRFADVVNPTVCIDPESVKKLVSPRTAAVIVVHLYGQPADGTMELSAWLRQRGVVLIEDCSHAIGAVDASGARVGCIGDIGVFSFQQQKNMVTLGEGGMCITSNNLLRERMIGYRSLCARSYDPKGKYLAIDTQEHPMGDRYWMIDFADHGHNFRMTDIQAAVGREQLKRVNRWNARRTAIARQLHEGLRDLAPAIWVPAVDLPGKAVCSWHVFHILLTDAFPIPKEEFMWSLLNEFGIKCWNHYCPMHLSTSFRSRGLGSLGDCPVAESLFEQYVSLPIHPRLADDSVAYMIRSIRELSRRPRAPRSSPTPLMDALLALSKAAPPSAATAAATATATGVGGGDGSSVVGSQLSLFDAQVTEALGDGFFLTGPGICITRAPGRLDLMGGNDDYTGGLVFECTIAEATFVAAQVNESSKEIIVRNRQLTGQDIRVPVSIFTRDGMNAQALAAYLRSSFPESRWPLYVIGVLLWLHVKYPEKLFAGGGATGLSLMLWSQVPLNRGVSSSASVEVAVMKAAAHVFGISLCGEVLATACQWVENEVCSSACGLMDQMAVTLGGPFMAMRCQPAIILPAPPLPEDITVYALDSGVSHEVSGIEYEAARAAAYMGYKIICNAEGLEVVEDRSGEIFRYKDAKYNGYLANMSPSVFARNFEKLLPEKMTGREYLEKYGIHVDPATNVLPEHVYSIRANTKYAVMENNRVNLFYQLVKGCRPSGGGDQLAVYEQLGELMYQSHDAYTECGLGSSATSAIVDLVRGLGPSSGLFGAKITGGGAGGTVAILGLRSALAVFHERVVRAYAEQRGLAQSPYVFFDASPGADSFGARQWTL
jgi:galactokinase